MLNISNFKLKTPKKFPYSKSLQPELNWWPLPYQGSALPPELCRHWAGDETRTRDPQLGRLMLYQLSYSRLCGPGWIRTTVGITPADLQSPAFNHSATDPYNIYIKKQSHWRDSNPRPADYKSAALANWATMANFQKTYHIHTRCYEYSLSI